MFYIILQVIPVWGKKKKKEIQCGMLIAVMAALFIFILKEIFKPKKKNSFALRLDSRVFLVFMNTAPDRRGCSRGKKKKKEC